MARPGLMQVIHTGGLRPSATSSVIDAAGMAAQAYITNRQKKQEEEAAVPGLVENLQRLDDKSRAPILSRLAQENPNLFTLVTAKLKPAPIDPLKAARPELMAQELGFNTDMKPYQTGPNGPIPGPVPAGWQPSPSDPAAAALQQSKRNAYLYGDKFATAAPIVGQTDRAQLTPADQPASLRVATGLQPKADTIAREAGADARNKRTTDATINGQIIRANRPTKTAAPKDNRLTEVKSINDQINKNKKEIRRVQIMAAKDPSLAATATAQISALNRENIALSQRTSEVKASSAPKAYTPAQEAKIKEYMDLSKKSREEVIAAMLAEKEL